MNLILTTAIAIFLLAIGYQIMDRLDRKLTDGIFIEEVKKAESYQAIIIGEGKLAKNLLEQFGRAQIPVLFVSYIGEEIPAEAAKYIFALTDSDFENISMCSVAKKIYGVKRAVSICNRPENRKIYEESHIKLLESLDQNPESIISWMQKAGKEVRL